MTIGCTALNKKLFQIIYLDNLEFGGSRTRQYILPRIVDFRFDVIRSMIQQDTNPNASDEGLKFGRLEVCVSSMLQINKHPFESICLNYVQLRHPFESIYTRGDKYRCIEVKRENKTGNGSSDDDVGVVS